MSGKTSITELNSTATLLDLIKLNIALDIQQAIEEEARKEAEAKAKRK